MSTLRSALALPTPLLPLLALLAAPLAAHGGAYNGPGNNAPSGGGSGGAGDSVPPPPSGGTASGNPTSVVPVCNPPTLATPTTPSGPRPPTPGMAEDNTGWATWWGHNQDAFLDVKGAIHASRLLPGSDEFFLGHVPPDQARDRLTPGAARVRAEVVPALFAALEGERDNDVVTGVLVALAKIGDAPEGSGEPPMAERIAPYLADPIQEIAETAAVALGIAASAPSVPVLTALLRDDPEGRARVGHPAGVPLRTRAFAAFGLGLIGSRVEDEALRAELVRTLVSVVEEAGPELSTPDVTVACLSAVGLVPLAVDRTPDLALTTHPWTSRQAQVAWLVERANDARLRDVARAHAPTAAARLLAGVDEPRLRARAVEAWSAALGRHAGAPREVRLSALLALGAVGTAGDGPTDRALRAALLEASLGGRLAEERHFALLALGQVAGRPATEGEPLAGTALVRRHLSRELEHGPSTARPWAALGLGLLGRGLDDAGLERDAAVDATLRAALADAVAPREVGALAIALGMRRDGAAVPVLEAQLAEAGDDDTRGYVCLALGMVGDPRALEPIQAVVRGARYRPELLRQAARALGLLGDKRLVPELVGRLEAARSLSAQASVAYGLGSIGDARSIEPLVGMLGDREITPRARAFAAVALGIVADKEPRPWNAKLKVGVDYLAGTATLADGSGAGILEIL